MAKKRLTLPRHKILWLIDSGRSVPLGNEQGSDRVHLLFYSRDDRYWFVVFRDRANGEIITIWPIDYHHPRKPRSWKISFEAQEEAKRLALGGEAEVQPEIKGEASAGISVHEADEPEYACELAFDRDADVEVAVAYRHQNGGRKRNIVVGFIKTSAGIPVFDADKRDEITRRVKGAVGEVYVLEIGVRNWIDGKAKGKFQWFSAQQIGF